MVRRRELNGKNTIMPIYPFKIKRDTYGRLIKNKSRICSHGGMQKLGVNYWETYSPVFIWICVRAMLHLSILRELHTKSVDF